MSFTKQSRLWKEQIAWRLQNTNNKNQYNFVHIPVIKTEHFIGIFTFVVAYARCIIILLSVGAGLKLWSFLCRPGLARNIFCNPARPLENSSFTFPARRATKINFNLQGRPGLVQTSAVDTENWLTFFFSKDKLQTI